MSIPGCCPHETTGLQSEATPLRFESFVSAEPTMNVGGVLKHMRSAYNADFKRTVRIVRVRGKATCTDLLLQGYRLASIDGDWFELRCPQSLHFDLSNPPAAYRSFGGTRLLSIWRRARRNAREMTKGTPNSLIRTEEIEAAVCIEGPDLRALRRFEEGLARRLQVELGLPVTPRASSAIAIEAAPREIRDFLDSLQSTIRADVVPGFEPVFPILSLSYISGRDPVWHSVRRLGEAAVFIGLGGISHALSYYLTTGDRPHVVEFHIGGDPYRVARRSHTETAFRWLTVQPPAEASLVVVDSAYTGQTLAHLARRLTQSTTRVALFPKSRAALSNADAIVFQGRIIPTAHLGPVLERRLWYVDLMRNKGIDRQW